MSILNHLEYRLLATMFRSIQRSKIVSERLTGIFVYG
jgi:hypothetical protein